MKLKGAELLVLLVLLSRARRRALPPAQSGEWEPEPGFEPLPVVPLPPNPLDQR